MPLRQFGRFAAYRFARFRSLRKAALDFARCLFASRYNASEMQMALNGLAVFLMALGLVGSLVPMLPGTPLIFLGAFIYGWSTDFVSMGWVHLSVLGVLALLAYLLEYLATALGAKWGGSRWAMAGAILGGIAGIFGGVVGILIGPIIGAIVLEWVNSREFQAGLQGGVGTAVGILFGVVAKLSVAVTMISLSVFWVFRA